MKHKQNEKKTLCVLRKKVKFFELLTYIRFGEERHTVDQYQYNTVAWTNNRNWNKSFIFVLCMNFKLLSNVCVFNDFFFVKKCKKGESEILQVFYGRFLMSQKS